MITTKYIAEIRITSIISIVIVETMITLDNILSVLKIFISNR